MTGDNQRFSMIGQLQQQFTHLDAGLWIQPVGRLVENEEGRIVQQGSSDGNPLLHSVTQTFDIPILHIGRTRKLHDFFNPSSPFSNW